MRAITGLVTAVLLAAIAGCGTVAATHHKRVGDGDHDQVVPVIVPVHCVHLRPVRGQGMVTLSMADNHKTFCVRRGTGVFVFLHGSSSHLWSPFVSSSAALSRRPSGLMALARGVTGGNYVAIKLGHATLTSSLLRCPIEPHPGLKSRCPPPMMYSVTVYVQR